jgi:hypothetical protein
MFSHRLCASNNEARVPLWQTSRKAENRSLDPMNRRCSPSPAPTVQFNLREQAGVVLRSRKGMAAEPFKILLT